MAGVLKKIPCCAEHGKPCYIKTGTKEGPMKGKTFFICGNQEAQCSFSAPASGLSTSDCPRHKTMRDLQAVCRNKGEIRCYYRCTEGRILKLGWCGFETFPFDVQFEKQLTDITNRHGSNSNREGADKRTEISDGFLVGKGGAHKVVAAMPGKENKRFDTHRSVSQGPSGKSFIPLTEKPHNYANDNAKSNQGQDRKQPANAKDMKASAAYNVNLFKKNPCEVILIDDDEEMKSGPEISTISKARNLHVDYREVGEVVKKKTAESNDFPSCEMLLKRQNALERELETKKGNLKWVNLQLLPDKGQRLIAQIKEIEQKLAEVKRQKMEAVRNRIQTHAVEKPSGAIPGSKNAKHIGQDALSLQSHQYQRQLLFRGPQSLNSERLYDGRMTQSKLKQVGRITKDAIETLHRSLETCPSPTTEIEDPTGLNVDLMPHQRQALAWLLWREKQMPSGGILADDMGLGKTLTSIALVMKDKQLGFMKKSTIQTDLRDSAGTLVVCPASLIHHWQKEIERRVKPLKLTVCLFHGQMREKNLERLSRYDIVLTTYSIVSMEMKDLLETESHTKFVEWLSTKGASLAARIKKPRKSLISQIHWRRIILDEAHNIKNHKCATSTAVCFLESESRWALTGTPVQNATKDLFAIIKFLRCSPFDEVKVWSQWVEQKGARGEERMNTLVRSLLLRRTKQQHLTSLPARASKVHSVSLEAKEKEVYDLLQQYSKNMLTAFLDNRGQEEKQMELNGKVTNFKRQGQPTDKLLFEKSIEELLEIFGLLNNKVNAGAILLMVLRLRQCCSHLSLLCEVPDEAECKEECIGVPLEDQMWNLSIFDDPFEASWNPEEFRQSFVSSKLRCLMEELQKLKSISKTGKQIKSVVVSQWTKMLDIIGLHLQRNGFKYDFITGRASLKKRSEIVEDFNTNPNGVQVILLSLRAGGVGLNLIGGSNLFLFDQHWNPALESQACDRIYRVGQENDVVIHRFLCTDTIEEKVAALQEKKKTLAESVLQGGKQTGNNLTLQDLRVLFGV